MGGGGVHGEALHFLEITLFPKFTVYGLIHVEEWTLENNRSIEDYSWCALCTDVLGHHSKWES